MFTLSNICSFFRTIYKISKDESIKLISRTSKPGIITNVLPGINPVEACASQQAHFFKKYYFLTFF